MDFNSLTPTLRKENCLFFRVMALLSLLSIVVILVTAFLSKDKNKSLLVIGATLLAPVVQYYIFLLFGSMCEGSLH